MTDKEENWYRNHCIMFSVLRKVYTAYCKELIFWSSKVYVINYNKSKKPLYQRLLVDPRKLLDKSKFIKMGTLNHTGILAHSSIIKTKRKTSTKNSLGRQGYKIDHFYDKYWTGLQFFIVKTSSWYNKIQSVVQLTQNCIQ